MKHRELGFLSWEEGRRREDAFAAFVEEYSPLVRSAVTNTLYRYSASTTREEVEDLHNGVIVGLMEDDFRRLRQFQGRSSLGTYVRVITTRHVIDFLRRQRKHVPLDADPTALDLADHRGSPQDHLERAEQELAVRRSIRQLQPRERLLLKLVFDRELKPSQVCRTLGITMSAYYNQKSRLMKKMRKLCEESAPGASQ
jgi:RNA polymerase sigma factor (sigma-70 family)